MRYISLTLACSTALVVLASPSTPVAQNADAGRYWGQWRGPLAIGVSPTANPPVEWSETKNVRWKVEIPGRGSSSPIVWGDRIFVTTAVPAGVTGDAQHVPRGGLQPRGAHRFMVMAIAVGLAERSGSASRASRSRTRQRTSRTGRGHRDPR